jgi:hypothetical protein
MNFEDRVSTYPNRYLMTDENGNTSYIILERADEPINPGTPLNAATMNAIQGSSFATCEFTTEDEFRGELQFHASEMKDGEYRVLYLVDKSSFSKIIGSYYSSATLYRCKIGSASLYVAVDIVTSRGRKHKVLTYQNSRWSHGDLVDILTTSDYLKLVGRQPQMVEYTEKVTSGLYIEIEVPTYIKTDVGTTLYAQFAFCRTSDASCFPMVADSAGYLRSTDSVYSSSGIYVSSVYNFDNNIESVTCYYW